ncbi:MAG TPA: MBL fold metallo-hydrolase [Balneolaceae bacterium]|nr:MBL fold metallo-hydrolase [Balneolaceae bacterium]
MLRFQKTGYHGLYFPDLGIALDGYHPESDYVFVSHAHADHMPRNRSTSAFATSATIDLMKLRGYRGEATALEFGNPLETDRFKATLYPAGHILGSAMVFLETDEGSLLYTGDYKTPPSPASEGFETPETADFLITEATFGLPIYRWKPIDELVEEIKTFATNSLNNGFTPVFLGYNLGKAQEILHILAPLRLPAMIHGAGYKLCKVYDDHNIDLGSYSAYDRDSCEGQILVAPSSALSNGFASNVSRKKVAYCSGWAANESRRTQLTAHKLIPLSDHLDFFELIRFCKELSPKKVFITHTPNPDVVQHYLDNEGIESSFLDLEAEPKD